MGALAALGQGIYGFYKGMDDQTRLDQERQQSQFNLDEAKRRSAAEQELQPLRMENARGAIDMMNASAAEAPLRTQHLQQQVDAGALTLGTWQAQAKIQAQAQKASELLHNGMKGFLTTGGTDYTPFEQSLSTSLDKPVKVTPYKDEKGSGLSVQMEGGQPTILYDGIPDVSASIPGLDQFKNETAANKLFHIAGMYATPGGVSAAMKADADRKVAAAKEAQALNLEEKKQTGRETLADKRDATQNALADKRTAAMIAAIGGRDSAAERKQAKKDAENYVRSYTAETKRIASVRGTTGPLATLINRPDVLISQAMPALRKKVQEDYPDLQGDQAAQKAWDQAEAQMSGAISMMQRKPETAPAMERMMQEAGWSGEAIREVKKAAKVIK